MTSKTTKTIYWVTTGIIFLWEGLMPALTSNSDLAKEGIRHLGYPDYFRVMLTVFKFLGAVTLLLPFVPKRIKEWAYAGCTFNLLAAFISHWAADGLSGQTFFPLFILAVLMASYIFYYKMKKLSFTKATGFKKIHHAVSTL